MKRGAHDNHPTIVHRGQEFVSQKNGGEVIDDELHLKPLRCLAPFPRHGCCVVYKDVHVPKPSEYLLGRPRHLLGPRQIGPNGGNRPTVLSPRRRRRPGGIADHRNNVPAALGKRQGGGPSDTRGGACYDYHTLPRICDLLDAGLWRSFVHVPYIVVRRFIMRKVGKTDMTRILALTLLLSTVGIVGAADIIEVGDVTRARDAVVQRAHEYKGTPYVWAGASAAGVDCTGLVYCVYDDVFGVKLPRGVPNLFAVGEQIAYEDLEPGDLVFFDTVGGISHVGIYIGDGDIIHAASAGRETGVITSNLSERYYATRYVGATRMLPSAASAGSRIAGAASSTGRTDSSAGRSGSSTAGSGRTGGGSFSTGGSSSSSGRASSSSGTGVGTGTAARVGASASSGSTGDGPPTRYEYPRGIGEIYRESEGAWVDTFVRDGTRYRFELEEHSRTKGFILFTDEERYVWIALYEETGEVFWLPLDADNGSEEWTLFANVTPVE